MSTWLEMHLDLHTSPEQDLFKIGFLTRDLDRSIEKKGEMEFKP